MGKPNPWEWLFKNSAELLAEPQREKFVSGLLLSLGVLLSSGLRPSVPRFRNSESMVSNGYD